MSFCGRIGGRREGSSKEALVGDRGETPILPDDILCMAYERLDRRGIAYRVRPRQIMTRQPTMICEEFHRLVPTTWGDLEK